MLHRGQGRQRAAVDHVLRNRVIARELLQQQRAHAVQPGIANVRDVDGAILEMHGRERGPHAGPSGFSRAALDDRAVGGLQGRDQLARLGKRSGQRSNGRLTRDVARSMATHAISNDKKTGVSVEQERIFVATANFADICQSDSGQGHQGIIIGTQVATPKRIMRVPTIILICGLITGCNRNPEERATSDPTPPPAAALTRQHQSIDEGLREVEASLARAMREDLKGDEAKSRLLHAEAVTDRLLEAELPFHWMRSRDYSVESSVRQIQALADRVIAKVRNGMDGQQLMADVREMRTKVVELRRGLAAGGGAAPLSLDTLLARYASDSTVVTDIGE